MCQMVHMPANTYKVVHKCPLGRSRQTDGTEFIPSIANPGEKYGNVKIDENSNP